MEYPADPREFMVWFKDRSERHFANMCLDLDAYGTQHQPGTKWRPGLTESELAAFEAALGFAFPEELRAFYRIMNGTDRPGVNVYGQSGLPYTYAPLYPSYPEHLPDIQRRIAQVLAAKGLTTDRMREAAIPFVFPLVDFYFLVLDGHTNPVYLLSPLPPSRGRPHADIYGELWTDTLQGWLLKDAFDQCNHVNDAVEFPDRPRRPNYWTSPQDTL